MRGEKKLSTTVYLDRSQVEALEELKLNTMVPIAVHIRLAIDRYLKAVEAGERTIGIPTSGQP